MLDHSHDHDDARGVRFTRATAGHGHAPADFGLAFAIGIALNAAYVIAEASYGIVSHSLALLADAGHNLGDVLALAAAWGAAILGRRRPAGRYTYGLRGSTILVAIGNAILLLVITGGIAWEAIRRLLQSPEPLSGLTIVIVAAAGVVINGSTALLFMAGRRGDLNIRAAFQHLASDAAVAFGVAIAGVLILMTGWIWLDPAISLAISVIVIAGTWSLLRESVNLALHAVPPGIEREAVAGYLGSLPGITAVHDLHIWGMSTTETALTAHLVRPEGVPNDALLRRAQLELQERFGIGHVTLQVETADEAVICRLAPDDIV
ncbi:MAG: cation transporter [Alphaproteobacteria bacterium]|nr:cation transporter [Alphaproteobacteria bacterium]